LPAQTTTSSRKSRRDRVGYCQVYALEACHGQFLVAFNSEGLDSLGGFFAAHAKDFSILFFTAGSCSHRSLSGMIVAVRIARALLYLFLTLNLPEICCLLHLKPTFGGASKHIGDTNRRLSNQRTLFIQNFRHSDLAQAKTARKLGLGDTQFRKKIFPQLRMAPGCVGLRLGLRKDLINLHSPARCKRRALSAMKGFNRCCSCHRL
jgi:hypothetical protein